MQSLESWIAICLSIAALILAGIGILYTHRSVRAPTLLEARKKHTAELIEFLKEWNDELPVSDNAIVPIITSEDIDRHWDKASDIEENWKYDDLIQHHLPKEFKTLPAKWAKYKENNKEYGEMRYQLCEKIKKAVLNETSLQYDFHGRGDHIILPRFIVFIIQHVAWLESGQLSADRKRDSSQVEVENEFWFGKHLLAKGTEEELFQLKKVFERMMFDEGYLTKYITDILRIIEMEKIQSKKYGEMKEILGKLTGYPVLPGTKCAVLRII